MQIDRKVEALWVFEFEKNSQVQEENYALWNSEEKYSRHYKKKENDRL